MNLKHVFKNECPNVDELFDGCDTLDKYFENLKKKRGSVKTARYMEHGFEALVEALIKCEKRVMRIQKYSPLPSCNNDLFVHGNGEKSSGKKIAVMVCLTDDSDVPLTSNANHLTTFASNAVTHYGVEVNEPKAFRIFSNAKSLHDNTKEQFFNDKSSAFYLRDDIAGIIDKNQKFWLRFKNMLKGVEKVKSNSLVTLRPYQNGASSSISTNTIGQIILPTGTGKSLIAIDSIYNEICMLKGQSPVIMIMTPRIVLTYQLLGEVVTFLKNRDVDAQYLNLSSGK